MSNVRQYELIYITPPESTEEALNELHAQILSVVDRFKGNIEKTENWGRRRLAYEIAGHREGVYVLELINGPAELNHARMPAHPRQQEHPIAGRTTIPRSGLEEILPVVQENFDPFPTTKRSHHHHPNQSSE